jgi:anti-sigma B factor antagonist
MPGLQITSKPLGDRKLLITLSGSLDTRTFEEFDQAMQGFISAGNAKIIVDMENVEAVSSAGAGVFIGCQPQVQENGGDIIIAHPCDNVKEVFEMLGINELFQITASIDEAANLLP